MQLIKTVAKMQEFGRIARSGTAVLGLVPTMGALHEGHLSLVRRAKTECDLVAASIFVNPLQFGPAEDFEKYPRTFEDDCEKLRIEGVAAVFAPDAAEMYPAGAVTTVTVAGLGDRLDGASRPGHFTGVATVVAKLLHAVGPQRAYFGQKDAVQLAVLRRMVRDLNFEVELVGCPIVRDAGGLALSSRNRYLSVVERGEALVIRRCLVEIERLIFEGEMSGERLVAEGLRVLGEEAGVRVDYLAIVDANSLLPVERVYPGCLVASAVWVGSTRLIDNFLVG